MKVMGVSVKEIRAEKGGRKVEGVRGQEGVERSREEIKWESKKE